MVFKLEKKKKKKEVSRQADRQTAEKIKRRLTHPLKVRTKIRPVKTAAATTDTSVSTIEGLTFEKLKVYSSFHCL